MPLYDFYCADCRRKFELFTSYEASSRGVACPTCDGSHVRKMFSVFAMSGRGDSPDAGEMSDYGDDAGQGGCSCGGACACGSH